MLAAVGYDGGSSENMIPWHHTDNMAKARLTLKAMYNHYVNSATGVDAPMKEFLQLNCIHLLDAPTGNTGVPKDYFDSSNWVEGDKSRLSPDYSNSLFNGLDSQTGVYTLYSEPNQEFCIGSTTDFRTRFYNHYADSVKPHLVNRLLYKEVNQLGGFQHFLWEPTVHTPNYLVDFLRDHLEYTQDYKVFRVLQTFTQYEARIYEQALQAHCSPKLNGPGDITFTTQWSPLDVRPSLLGERPFMAITEGGTPINFESMNSATHVLGVSRKTISSLMNFPDNYSYCPGIDNSCRFFEPQNPLKVGSPYTNPYLLPDFNGVDYSQLPLEGVHAFTEDLQPYATFTDSTHAASECGFGSKYYNVSRWINKRFISCVIGGVTIKLLFAQNPLIKGGCKPVRCEILDLDNSEPFNFKSINECIRELKLDVSVKSTSAFIKNYIKPGKPYKGKYLITYITK